MKIEVDRNPVAYMVYRGNNGVDFYKWAVRALQYDAEVEAGSLVKNRLNARVVQL